MTKRFVRVLLDASAKPVNFIHENSYGQYALPGH